MIIVCCNALEWTRPGAARPSPRALALWLAPYAGVTLLYLIAHRALVPVPPPPGGMTPAALVEVRGAAWTAFARSLAFLWPNLKGGFGSVIPAGNLDDIKNFISQNKQPFYYGAGRFYIVPYSGNGTNSVYAGITQDGLMALYQKCVHLGCRVPFCQTSQWFECPCHGSKYNEAGEYQLGPAPTGLNRFKIIVEGDKVMVDTSASQVGGV